MEPEQAEKKTNINKVIMLSACAVLVVLVIAAVVTKTTIKEASSTPQALITVSSAGFTPATIQVKPGTIITWKNSDNAPHHIASNPYPSDNSVADLNSKTLVAGRAYSYKVSGSKTIQYHDDLNPTHNGTIVIKD